MNREIVRTGLFLIGLGSIGGLAYYSWPSFTTIVRELNWWFFGASLILGVMANGLTALYFEGLLFKYGQRRPTQPVLKIFLFAQIAKYIPGKVWGMLMQRTYLHDPGATGAVLFSNLDLQIVTLISNLGLGLGLLALPHHVPLAVVFLALAFAFTILWSCTVLPHTLATKAVSRWPWLAGMIAESTTRMPARGIFAYFAGYWLFHLSGLLILLTASFNLPIGQAVVVAAVLALSVAAAAVVFVVPAGMGVRELVFVVVAAASADEMSTALLAALAVGVRMWGVLVDLLGAALVALPIMFSGPQAPHNLEDERS